VRQPTKFLTRNKLLGQYIVRQFALPKTDYPDENWPRFKLLNLKQSSHTIEAISMTDKITFEAPSWRQIYSMLIRQSQRICGCGFKPDVIVGISRGGWVPARVLSDLLENANLANVRVECYVGIGESYNQARLAQGVSADVEGKHVLAVDEITDSGRSLQLAVAHLLGQGARQVKTASLFCKPNSAFEPDFCEKQTMSWVVFPWEIKETVRLIHESRKIDPARAEEEFVALAAVGVPKQLITRFLREFSEANTC